MSKRRLKEFVGPRQRSRRALQATKEEFASKSSPNIFIDCITDNTTDRDYVSSIGQYAINTSGSCSVASCSLSNSESLKFYNASLSPEKPDLSKQLAEWAIEKHISHSSLTDLLHLLSPYHPELPLDSRTLLATPNTTSVKDLETGQFIYFSMKETLLKLISDNISTDKIQISFNVDGIPLYKSSKLQL